MSTDADSIMEELKDNKALIEFLERGAAEIGEEVEEAREKLQTEKDPEILRKANLYLPFFEGLLQQFKIIRTFKHDEALLDKVRSELLIDINANKNSQEEIESMIFCIFHRLKNVTEVYLANRSIPEFVINL